MSERAEQTRSALLEAAASLFAEHGPENVSLNEITRAAGQRNASALQYHFGGRDGLLRAILQPRLAAVDARRAVILDELEEQGAVDAEGLARALVEPLAAELEAEEGRAYLRIMAQLMREGRRAADGPVRAEDSPASLRLAEMARALRPDRAPEVGLLQTRLLLILLWNGLVDWLDVERRPRGGTREEFVRALTAGIAALV